MPRGVPPHTTNKSAGRITSSGATPSAPGPCRRFSLLSNPIFHQIPGDDDARSRQRNDLVLARLQSGAWEFRVEVAILERIGCVAEGAPRLSYEGRN